MSNKKGVHRDYTQKSGNIKLCECGCGEYIPAINKLRQIARFKHGHNAKGGRHWAYSDKRDKTREKISSSKMGHEVTQETKQKMSIGIKEVWKNPEHREKCLAGWKKFNEDGRHRKSEFKKGHIPHNKDKPHLPGPLNPNWKGGNPQHSLDDMKGDHRYGGWRRRVFERDNYTCQDCGERGGRLEAHHIKPWALFKELRYEVSNGLTLCHKCHQKTKKPLKKLFPDKI